MAMCIELIVKLHTRASLGGWSKGPAREENTLQRLQNTEFRFPRPIESFYPLD